MSEFNETTGADLAVVQSSLDQDIENLKQGRSKVMSSFKGEDRETKINVLSAMTDSASLDDVLNTEFTLANFIIQPIEMPDEDTGELREVPRVILVTDEGVAYHAISGGILSSIQRITGVLGMPGSELWPVKVMATEEKTRRGYKVFTLKVTG